MEPYRRTRELYPGPTPPSPLIPRRSPKRVRLHHCYIQYGLEASTHQAHSHEIFLTFSPIREEAIPDESLITAKAAFRHASSRLQPGHEEISRSFKVFMHDTFSSSVPNVVCQIHVSLPKVIVLGQPIQILVILTYDSSSTAVAPPRFTIKVPSVRLKAETAVRATREGIFGFSDRTRDTNMPVTLVSNWAHQTPASSPRSSALSVEIRARTPKATNVAPTFHSFSISNTHQLRASIAITVAGKTFEEDLYSQNVMVLPARHRGQPPPGTPALPPPMGMPGPVADGDQYASVPPPDDDGSQAPPPMYGAAIDANGQVTTNLVTPMAVGEETIPTEQGLMLRYGPQTGIGIASTLCPAIESRRDSSSGASVAAAMNTSGLPPHEG